MTSQRGFEDISCVWAEFEFFGMSITRLYNNTETTVRGFRNISELNEFTLHETHHFESVIKVSLFCFGLKISCAS